MVGRLLRVVLLIVTCAAARPARMVVDRPAGPRAVSWFRPDSPTSQGARIGR